jgi:hypothetical protein
MKKSAILLLLCFCAISLFSQVKSKTGTGTKSKPKLEVYKSCTGMFYGSSDCYYTAKKYTTQQLYNTELFAAAAVSTHAYMTLGPQFTNIDIDSLCSYIDKCPLVDLPFWQNMRPVLKNRVIAEYEFKKLLEDSKKNPDLLDNTLYAAHKKYATVIAKGTDQQIKDMWKICFDISMENNYSKEYHIKRYNEQRVSADWKKHAFNEIGNMLQNKMNDIFFEADNKKVVSDAGIKFRKLFVKIVEEEI